MLKPYIVQKDAIRVIGKSASFGGDTAQTGQIGDLFAQMDSILGSIPNRVDDKFFGISIDFWHRNREGGRVSYMLGAEVSTLNQLPHALESRIIPASRWLYIPVRYDDEAVRALVSEKDWDDMSCMTVAVFDWAKTWIADKGYVKQDFPEELEIYGLYEGYAYPHGAGANLTLALPIV